MCRILILIFLVGSNAWSQELKYGQISLSLEGGDRDLHKKMVRWINDSAYALERYFGKFPLRQVTIAVKSKPGRAVNGRAFGFIKGRIDLQVGSQIHFPGFSRYWVMTHELVHLATPDVGEGHQWLMEGIATYVEPIARYQIGQLNQQQVLLEWWDNFPKGLPSQGRGLNQDDSWAARYWGGALFCFLLDVELRKHSGNRRGLQGVLSSIAENSKHRVWTMETWLDEVAKTSGSRVVYSLYERMANNPIHIDLKGMWKDLGVQHRRGKISLQKSSANSSIILGILNRH